MKNNADGKRRNLQPVFTESSSLRDAEWLRLPLPGARCPISGLSRTTLIELGEQGSIVMKRIIVKPRASRGIVVINKRSLLDYLDQLRPAVEPELCPAA